MMGARKTRALEMYATQCLFGVFYQSLHCVNCFVNRPSSTEIWKDVNFNA